MTPSTRTPHLVHIGFPKTGSTSLQQWFEERPDLGYRTDGFGGFDTVLDLARTSADPAQTVRARVTSTEELSQPMAGDAHDLPDLGIADRRTLTCQRLHALFADATVLIVTRGWAGVLASAYSQYLRIGGSESFETFLTGAAPDNGDRVEDHYDYDATIALYTEVFGAERVLVLPFELLREDSSAFLSVIERRLGMEPSGDVLPDANLSVTDAEFRWYPRFSRAARRIAARLGSRGPAFFAFYRRRIGGTTLRRASRLLALLYPESELDPRSRITPEVLARCHTRARATAELPGYEPYRSHYVGG